MKKWFAALLTLTMLLGLMGGGTALAADKPITITIGATKTASFQSGWLEYDSMKLLQEKLGIKLDYTEYDDDSFNLMLAGGDLPDIVIGIQQAIPSIITNKLALDVYPLLDEYAPNVKQGIYESSIGILRDMLGGEENALYFFAPNVGVENADGGSWSSRGYIVRWDYYKEIGSPEIHNDDDYLAALKAMQALHPTTTDGKQTYGIGVEQSLGDMGGYRASFLKPTLLNPWSFSGSKYACGFDDAELYNGYTNLERSSFWSDMTFYNKVYREGLFDPDCFTMSYDEYLSKIAAGTYMGLYFLENTLYEEMSATDPATLAAHIVIPSEGSLTFSNKLSLLGNTPAAYSFISAASPNWQKCLEIYNMLYDQDFVRLMYSGEQGVHWDYDADGVPHMFEETMKQAQEGGEAWRKTGIGVSLKGLTAFYATTKHPDGYYYDLAQEKENRALGQNAMRQDYCDTYGVSYPTEILCQYVEEGRTIDMSNDYGQTIAAGVSNVPMDIKRIMDACNDILYRAMPRLVMAESDEAFAAIQAEVFAQLKEAGEETAWTWCLSAWNESKAAVEPLFLAAKEELK